MADPPRSPEFNSNTGDDTALAPDPEDHRTPRWVKVFAIIAIALLLLFVILHLTGRGLGGHSRPSSITGHGMEQP